MLIDTHCHLHDPEWFSDREREEFLENAQKEGVEELICIGTNHTDSLVAEQFAREHGGAYWTYGIHPEFAEQRRAQIELARAWFRENYGAETRADARKLVAIGEVGLDYHYEGFDRAAQIRLFEETLQLAQDYDLPVSLHLRAAFADAFAILDNFPGLCGVIHSFIGSKRDLKKALERGFYIGVNGLITYNTIALPPLERMVLETDAPFLTPVPYRDRIKTNQPAYVKAVMVYLAQKLAVPENKIAEETTENARKLFRI